MERRPINATTGPAAALRPEPVPRSRVRLQGY